MKTQCSDGRGFVDNFALQQLKVKGVVIRSKICIFGRLKKLLEINKKTNQCNVSTLFI